MASVVSRAAGLYILLLLSLSSSSSSSLWLDFNLSLFFSSSGTQAAAAAFEPASRGRGSLLPDVGMCPDRTPACLFWCVCCNRSPALRSLRAGAAARRPRAERDPARSHYPQTREGGPDPNGDDNGEKTIHMKEAPPVRCFVYCSKPHVRPVVGVTVRRSQPLARVLLRATSGM